MLSQGVPDHDATLDPGDFVVERQLRDVEVQLTDGIGNALPSDRIGRNPAGKRGHAVVDHVRDHQLDAARHQRVDRRGDIRQDGLVMGVDLGVGPCARVDPLVRGVEGPVIVLADGHDRVVHQSVVDLLGQPGVLRVGQKRSARGAGHGPVELVALLAHVGPRVRKYTILSHVHSACGHQLDPVLGIGGRRHLIEVFVREAVTGHAEPQHRQHAPILQRLQGKPPSPMRSRPPPQTELRRVASTTETKAKEVSHHTSSAGKEGSHSRRPGQGRSNVPDRRACGHRSPF